MSEKKREFYIASVVTGESGRTTLIGRASVLPIPVGTKFTVTYKEKRQKFPNGYTANPPREQENPICLTVESASVYGKPVNEIPGSTTGSLVLNESNMEHLSPGWMLSEK